MALDFSGIDQALTSMGFDPEQAGRLLNFARMQQGPRPGDGEIRPSQDANGSAPSPRQSLLSFGGVPAAPQRDPMTGLIPEEEAGKPRLLNFGASADKTTPYLRTPEPSSMERGGGLLNFRTAQSPRPSTDLPSEQTLGAQNSDAGLANAGTNVPLSASRMMTAANHAGGTEPQSLEAQYSRLLNQEPTREQFPAQPMGTWKKLLGVALSTLTGLKDPNAAGETARAFFGAPQDKADRQYNEAKEAWIDKLGELMRGANIRHLDLEDRNLQSEIDARNRNPKQEKPDALNQQYLEAERRLADAKTPEEKAAAQADMDAIEHAATLGQRGNQTRNTNPFEAFAYGTSEERKAAQDFLDYEKKIGARYEKPGEVEQRYSLYQRDPEAYKAMYGDRGAAQDSANASRMLTFFNKRRQEIQNDWTLDEKQKADQLAEIDQLSAPYLNATQPSGTNKGGGAGDRVTVRDKDGNIGTVPRSNLKKALKKGYSLVQ
jgi:hypothetical protein